MSSGEKYSFCDSVLLNITSHDLATNKCTATITVDSIMKKIPGFDINSDVPHTHALYRWIHEVDHLVNNCKGSYNSELKMLTLFDAGLDDSGIDARRYYLMLDGTKLTGVQQVVKLRTDLSDPLATAPLFLHLVR